MKITAILSSLRYLLASRPYALEKPIVLQFPVVDICNSRCRMCRIWENKRRDVIDADQLRKGLRNDLFSEVASVGLNGGEPTLRDDLGALASVLFEELPKLESISLITNAYNVGEVISRISDVGEVARRHGGKLDVMVSLDGYGSVHDQVRGKAGNFSRAEKVIEFAQSSPLVGNLRIGCTIIKDNVLGLHDLLEYCQGHGLYVKFRLGIPHQRLYTQDLIDPYSLTLDEKYHVIEFFEGLIANYEPNELQRFFYRSLVDQLADGAARKAGCDWRHRGATITSKGELLYCAVQSKPLGVISSGDSAKMYFSNAPHLKEIIESKCDSCYHDYVGLPPRKQLAKQLSIATLKRSGLLERIKGGRLHGTVSKWRFAQNFERRRQRFCALVDASTAERTSSPAVRHALICGWYGTETLGDKGILGGIIRAIKSAVDGEIRFTVVSLHPYVTRITQRQMPELVGAQIVGAEEGVRLAGTVDMVFFGGGPLMGIPEIAEMEAIFDSAGRHGVPTIVAGCGVGPLGPEPTNKSIARLLSRADLRIFRDERSRASATEMGVDTRGDLVAEDPAFTWLHAVKPGITANRSQTGKVLLLGLRDFPYEQYARHLSHEASMKAKAAYETAVYKALEVLLQKFPALVIRPVPMCTNHFGGDDRWFYRRLFRNIGSGRDRIDKSLLGAELSPTEYCRSFMEADAALVMRFHSLVFALGLGLPAVAVDYTLGRGKVAALAERFGVPHQSLERISADFLVNEISRLLGSAEGQGAGFEPAFSTFLGAHLPSLLERRLAAGAKSESIQ